MKYDDLGNQLAPMGKEDGQPKKLIDQNVLKKGLNHISREKKAIQNERDFYLKEEEEKIKAEEKVKETAVNVLKKRRELEEDARIDKFKEQAKGGSIEKSVDMEGKWKMDRVNNLPDEVDEVINQLDTCVYEAQDLDVLIELSKKLKEKRLNMFEDIDRENGIHN